MKINIVNKLQSLVIKYLDTLYLHQSAERREFQENIFTPNQYCRFLDLGCKDGINTIRIANKIRTNWVIGIDYNFDVLHKSSQKIIIPLIADLNKSVPLKNESIDVILASDVLEHLYSTNLFIAETFRVLKPGGILVVDTPNLASWHNIFALIIGIQPFSGPNITTMEDSDLDIVRKMHRLTHGLNEEGEFEEHSELELTRHIVVIAYTSLKNLLKSVGFRIEKEYGLGYYPFPPFIAHIFQHIDIRHTHHLVMKIRKVV